MIKHEVGTVFLVCLDECLINTFLNEIDLNTIGFDVKWCMPKSNFPRQGKNQFHKI